MGFDKSNVLVLSNTDALEGNFKEFKNELLEIPMVKNASYSSRVPGITGGPINQFTPEAKAATLMSIYMVDEDFLETMDIN